MRRGAPGYRSLDMIHRIALVLLAFLAPADLARAADLPTEVRFPSVKVGGIGAGPELTGWIYRPEGTRSLSGDHLRPPLCGVHAERP